MTTPMVRANFSSRTMIGAEGMATPASAWAMRPTSVCTPVWAITASARPLTTVVPANSMLTRSATPVSGASTAPASFSTGADSPGSRD